MTLMLGCGTGVHCTVYTLHNHTTSCNFLHDACQLRYDKTGKLQLARASHLVSKTVTPNYAIVGKILTIM